jgi:hypothetical protein
MVDLGVAGGPRGFRRVLGPPVHGRRFGESQLFLLFFCYLAGKLWSIFDTLKSRQLAAGYDPPSFDQFAGGPLGGCWVLGSGRRFRESQIFLLSSVT